MTDMPAFDFSGVDITEEEVQKDAEQQSKPKSKRFQPGQHDLEVKSAVFNKFCADSTWFSAKLYFASPEANLEVETDPEGKDVVTCVDDNGDLLPYQRHYLLVPTSNIQYQKPGGKPTMFLFHKFREFMAAIGEQARPEDLGKLVPKFFKDNKAMSKQLEGQKLKAEIGYTGCRGRFIEEGKIQLLEKDGTPKTDDGGNELFFPDYDALERHCNENGLKVSRGPEVVAFLAQDKPAKKEEVKKEELTDW